MQSKEFISKAKYSFRDLRKGETKLKKDLVLETGISWATLTEALKDMLVCGVLKELPTNRLILNPNYELFAGIYISKDSIYLSVIDFSGKEICSKEKKFNDFPSFFKALEEILKLKSSNKIKALAICSDNCFDYNGNARITDIILLDNRIMESFIPKGVKYYFEKTCVTNSWKWYDNCDVKDSELNVVFSFFENNCYYTIMKNSSIIQKRRYSDVCENADNLYENVIIPVWKAINPNYMAFITSSEEMSNLINEHISEWDQKIYINHYHLNNNFEIVKPTKLIAENQFHPSESAALYAMYRYYGWAE